MTRRNADAARCTLMHRETPVLDMPMERGVICPGIKVLAPEHLPVGVELLRGGAVDRPALQEWLDSRAVPSHRYHLEETLRRLHVRSVEEVLERGLRLSLSDQYWLRPWGTDVAWEEVNFFDNHANQVSEFFSSTPC